jgi:hypothetical protein
MTTDTTKRGEDWRTIQNDVPAIVAEYRKLRRTRTHAEVMEFLVMIFDSLNGATAPYDKE